MSDHKPAKPAGELDLDQAFGGFFKGLGGIFAAFVGAMETASNGRSGTQSAGSREWGGGGRQARHPSQRWTVDAPEPLIDLFDEGRVIILVAALPAAYASEVLVEVQDDILSLRVTGPQRWEREILLPALVSAPTLSWTLRNSILELRVVKLDGDAS